MPQDAFTLNYLCKELNNKFSGGKINRIIAPDNDEIIFTVYTGKRTDKLFISVNPGSPRMGITNIEKESPLTASNFCMLLRKHLLSATIDGISLVGFDRIVKIDLTASDEFFDAQKKVLYIELMGRYSNVILTQDGRVLGGNRGINCFDNGVRPLIVNRPYVFPPVGEKLLPLSDDIIEYFNKFTCEDLSAYICAGIQGVANSTAQEICVLYKKKYEQFNGLKFANFLREYLYNSTPSPCVYIKDGNVYDVCAVEYVLAQGKRMTFDSLIEAEAYYFEQKERLKTFTALKTRLNGIVGGAIKRAKKKLTAITSREKDAQEAEENKIKGELILANIYKIKQGEKSVTLLNYYNNEQVKITLEENLTPSKNAERYFKKYNKEKRTLIAIAPLKKQAQNELDYLNKLNDFISLCETIDDLVSIKEELIEEGLLVDKAPKQKNKKQQPSFREYLIDGFVVKVGKNNVENERVTFTAKPTDIWLHAKDFSSSHCIIECEGKKVPEKTLIKASEICAYYSKGREGGKVEIVYTERKNVKKNSGAKRGSVIYDNYKSLTVEPKNHAEFLKTAINA